MGNPSPHNWQVKPSDDDEVDPVEEMIKKTGCLEKHYAVAECMAENKDWRICKDAVTAFKECMSNYYKNQSTPNYKIIDNN